MPSAPAKFGKNNKWQKHGPDLPNKKPCLKLKHQNVDHGDLKCNEFLEMISNFSKFDILY